MRVVYIGNFEPEHSTENHVRRALVANGHQVVPVQESFRESWFQLSDREWLRDHADVVLWTRTRWPWHRDPAYMELHWKMLVVAERLGITTVGFHLDRWWGLAREDEVRTEPFFRVNLLVTADGGHDDLFEQAGVNHVWMPPGVSAAECELGSFDAEYASDIAFVGSWRGYHPEWPHRDQLVRFLMDTYGDRVRFWPVPGRHALRGQPLRDLYASAKVLVGDSCLVPRNGDPIKRYCSDRIPETLGRGGFLIHPAVAEVTDSSKAWMSGKHLDTWQLDDWADLRAKIDAALDDDDRRRRVAKAGRTHTLKHHTYEQRMVAVMDRVLEVM